MPNFAIIENYTPETVIKSLNKVTLLWFGFDKNHDMIAVCMVGGDQTEQLITQEWLDDYFGQRKEKFESDQWGSLESRNVSYVELKDLNRSMVQEYLENEYSKHPEYFVN